MKLKRLHYGWVVALVGACILVTNALLVYTFGVFLKPMTMEFNWDNIKKEVEQELLERHEQNIDDIAFDPNVPPQTRLLGSFFKVKKLDPSYRDSYTPSVNIGNITIQLMIPKYDDSLALEQGNVIEGEGKELDGHS